MVREEHFQFNSNEGTVRSHGVRWIPEGEARAVLQIVHGMTEHVERYREFAMYLANQGILVVGHDHLGHGDSVKSPEDYGFFAEKDGNNILIADMRKVYRITKKRQGDVPYVFLGHSMGSFLTRQYLCMYGGELDGAVICGTGCPPAAVARLGMAICRAEAKRHGWRYRSPLLKNMSLGSYNKKFAPNRTSVDWLTRDEGVADSFVEDAKSGFDFTLNGYYNLFLSLTRVVRKDSLQRMPKELPVLFISGEEDPVGDFGKGVRKAVRLFRKNGMKDVECRLYPEDRHEILNEPDKQQVYEDVLDWMERKKLLP